MHTCAERSARRLAARALRDRTMNLKQHYQEKAAKAERLADEPYQRAELRVELRSTARRWRHLAEQADWLTRQPRDPKHEAADTNSSTRR